MLGMRQRPMIALYSDLDASVVTSKEARERLLAQPSGLSEDSSSSSSGVVCGGSANTESLLWAASMAALERGAPSLAAAAQVSLASLASQSQALGSEPFETSHGVGALVNPAWPCTECLAAAPVACICVTCFC